MGKRSSGARFGALLLSVIGSFAPLPAPGASDSDVQSALENARRAITETGEYEAAISLLDEVIAGLPENDPLLRDAYVARIQASIAYANSRQIEEPHVAKNLRDDAFGKVMECLGKPALRHARPREDEPFHAEMSAMFSEARSILFGSLRITELEPATARVILGGDTLRAGPDGTLEAADVPIGPKEIEIQAEDYRTLRETLEFKPGEIQTRPYRLEKGRGSLWWGSRIGGGALLVGGLIALLWDDDGTSVEPLPGPPDPPR